MNKVSTVLLIMTILIESAFGQEKENLLINFNIGPSMSNFVNRAPVYRIDGNGLYRPINTSFIGDGLWGITLNIGIEYYLSDRLSINSGLAYEQKGIFINYDSTFTSENGDYKAEITFEKKIANHYLTIPLTVKKYFFKEKSLYLEAGFYSGIFLFSRLSTKEISTSQFSNENPMIATYNYVGSGEKGHTSKFDFGVSFGAGYKKVLTDKLSLVSSIKLNIGLHKIDALNSNEVVYRPSGTDLIGKTIYDYYGLNSNARNTNITLTFGITYELN